VNIGFKLMLLMHLSGLVMVLEEICQVDMTRIV